MRIRLSTLALSLTTATALALASYWRGRTTWYSQDEIDAWETRAKIELADLDEDLSPNGEAKMLVARHEDPIDPRMPFYWHVAVAGPSDAGAFRPVIETFGWAPTRAYAVGCVNDAAEDLLLELLVQSYDAYEGIDLEGIEFDDDDDVDGVPSA